MKIISMIAFAALLAGQFVLLGTSVSAEPVPYSASGEAPGLQPVPHPANTQRTPQVEDSRAEEWRERRRQKGQEIVPPKTSGVVKAFIKVE
ncbi:MAG: hypothetical protein VST67_09770, partial [Nitrospirota bacterium]|nr:hypothetical protein [Nitrospirota bacterium]